MKTSISLSVILLMASVPISVIALGSQAAPATGRLAFEVVSIKRTPDDTGPGADFGIRPGGRLHARNNETSNLITNAYGIPYYAVIGGPDWVRAEKYDIEAKSDSERPAA